MTQARTHKELREKLTSIHREGQGVWCMAICSPATVPDLLMGAMAGEPDAVRIMQAVASSLGEIAKSPANKPVLCLTCDNAFGCKALPIAFAFVYAHRDDPSLAIGNGICMDCYDRHPGNALMELVADYYRRNVITDLRVLPRISEPGRA